ncbi:lysozyme inhibitor LprI family protein [Thalassococcus lentus]|uniref:DUF1311 domain-containing protein n=1 Tax=Thalassococcus lentus TaxID=1210524 RepID=A0ABT4XX89_9RHOB|nr:lysozyme inhibitor LprI family protein [Thalassococcus lentus]MDA7426585.1 DUF1311 domain-containing protein [Thalassococcus lentus]
MFTRVALAAIFCSGPLFAQDLVFSPTETEICLHQNPGAESSCIGLSAEQCMVDTDGGGSTVGMGACLDQELQYWDTRLNAAYQARLAEAKAADKDAKDYGYTAPPQEENLRAMQRAWIGFRDARCDYARSLWGGGTGGGPAAIGCLMHTTGEQALYLEQFVR